jgi:hypothetical protein
VAATCATITTVHTPPNCRPPLPAVVCLSRWPMPRVIFIAGMMPATAAPATVSTIATANVRGERLRSNQKGRRLC